MNPWHNVEPRLDLDNKEFNTIIEISSGSKSKYELDQETGLLKLDRVLYSAVRYPANYGFVPKSLGQDNDPLDVLVLCQEPIIPLSIVHVRAIGGFKLVDDKGIDDKIICVHTGDPVYGVYKNLKDLNPHFKKELIKFFEDYKKLEKKTVEIGKLYGPDQALKIVVKSLDRYLDYPHLSRTPWPTTR